MGLGRGVTTHIICFFLWQNGITTVAWRLVISQHQPNTSHNIYITLQR